MLPKKQIEENKLRQQNNISASEILSSWAWIIGIPKYIWPLTKQ